LRKDLDAFFEITERWRLNSTERRALLGVASKERWSRCLHDAAPQLSQQELLRARAVIQIDETLSVCLGSAREVALWFRTRKVVAPFSGRTPLALLFRGMTGFNAVGEHLVAWRNEIRMAK